MAACCKELAIDSCKKLRKTSKAPNSSKFTRKRRRNGTWGGNVKRKIC
jgi:hypothetical protein